MVDVKYFINYKALKKIRFESKKNDEKKSFDSDKNMKEIYQNNVIFIF
jgi:hypothetical protein